MLTIDLDPFTYWYVDTFVKVPSNPIFRKLGISNVYDIYNFTTLKFVYESVNKSNPTQFHLYYNYPKQNINTKAKRQEVRRSYC